MILAKETKANMAYYSHKLSKTGITDCVLNCSILLYNLFLYILYHHNYCVV